MKKSVKTRIVCLCAAAVLLCSSLAVAAANGSPYEVLKQSILGLTKVNNATLELNTRVSVDGVEEVSNTERMKITEDATMDIYDSGNFTYNSKDFYINKYSESYNEYTLANNISSYSVSRQSYADDHTFSLMGGREITNNEYRIAELAADMLSGDLKNSIAMERKGDTRYISGTVTASQFPELYALILDYVAKESGSSYMTLERNVVESYDLDSMTAKVYDKELRGNTLYTTYRSVSLLDESYPGYDVMQNEMNKWLEESRQFKYSFGYTPWDAVTIEGKLYFVNCTESRTETTKLNAAETRALYTQYDRNLSGMDAIEAGIESMKFLYAHGEATVNDDGIITSVNARGEFSVTDVFGTEHEVIIYIDGTLTDIGTTVVDPPLDLNELDRVLGNYDYSRIDVAADGTMTCVESYYDEKVQSIDTISVTSYTFFMGKDIILMDGGAIGVPGADSSVETYDTLADYLQTITADNEVDFSACDYKFSYEDGSAAVYFADGIAIFQYSDGSHTFFNKWEDCDDYTGLTMTGAWNGEPGVAYVG